MRPCTLTGRKFPQGAACSSCSLPLASPFLTDYYWRGLICGRKGDESNLTALKSPTCQRYARTSAPLQHGAVPSPWGVVEAPRRPPAARTYVMTSPPWCACVQAARGGAAWRSGERCPATSSPSCSPSCARTASRAPRVPSPRRRRR